MRPESAVQRLSVESGVRVWVPGRPRTKGSLKPTHVRLGGGRCRAGLREDGEHSVPWKNTMIRGIRLAALCERAELPVEVHTFFRFQVERVDGDAGDAAWPTGRQYGDEDKLRRNVLDALTQSGLIKDDSQVVGGQNWKRWVEPGEAPGVWIVVAPVRVGADWLHMVENSWGQP